MAGYLMNMEDYDSIVRCIETGTYSTIMHNPKRHSWSVAYEGTFADYLSMKAGNHIYFFNDRKIYGIGELIDIAYDCKYLNYEGADKPVVYNAKEYKKLKPLMSEGNYENRCICLFRPSPFFLQRGWIWMRY